ncbi:MAG: bifunctional phosphopantothenoylcysteine decarboxylase/phosphopantothenate--cysteine ligase CoaBC [Burkholderiaceae bacterium]
MGLEGKRILLGVTGGVAAFKAAYLARELQRRGATVQPVLTEAATHFVGVATFQALTGQPVFTDQWDQRIDNGMPHIELSRQADAILIAPASADFLAKLANGLCDDLLATLCLARNCPLVVAPAMNLQMWMHPATRRNVARLRDDGVTVFGPGSGDQACGETGDGRMLEAEELAERMQAFFVPKRLAGRRVLLTAGPTFEPIDPVRGITNLSSGRMGFALARACRQAGAEVVVVAGPSAQPTPLDAVRIDVTTAEQMARAVGAALDASRFDVFIAVAAVADWRVVNYSDSKLKKTDDGRPPALEFTQNPDILATVARRPDAPYCVGFAAESEDLEANGAAKRERKGVPLLVGNIGHETFGRDENELLLIDARSTRRLPRASKDSLAAELVAEIAARLDAPG